MKTRYQCLLTAAILALSTISSAGALIDGVQLVAPAIGPTQGISQQQAKAVPASEGKKTYTFSWTLKQPGQVTVLLCDLSGNIVSTFHNKVETSAGTQSFSWDGTDDAGNQCPPGLYFPVIRVKSAKRGVDSYNPTSLFWGEKIIPKALSYDAENKTIRYSINQAALVRIRVGDKEGGPMYRTITNWKLLSPGTYEEPWNGMDVNELIDVPSKEKFTIAFDAFTVPENSLFVQSEINGTQRKAAEVTYKKYPVFPPNGKKITYFPLLDHGLLPDLSINARFADSNSTPSQVVQLNGDTPIIINLTQGALARNPKEGIELYLFVDGQMIYDEPAQQLPTKIYLDSRKFSNGLHFVTINLRTSSDRTASFSQKVQINN